MPRLVIRHGVKGFVGHFGMVLETHRKKVEFFSSKALMGANPPMSSARVTDRGQACSHGLFGMTEI